MRQASKLQGSSMQKGPLESRGPFTELLWRVYAIKPGRLEGVVQDYYIGPWMSMGLPGTSRVITGYHYT